MAIMIHDMREILGEDFFQEEIRCDYLVSAKMKRIWAVLLDMYMSFAEVCDKYNLKYFAFGGSVLGAVRHGGFIPWDDDIDVGLFRKDYEFFLKVAEKELPEPLFLQTPYTDDGYYGSGAKIRNSSTAAVDNVIKHNRFNQGLFIDVFPIDDCCLSTAEADREKIYELVKKCGVAMRKGSRYLTDRQKQDEIRYATKSPLQDWENVQKIASNPNYKNSEYCTLAVFTGYPTKNMIWRKNAYSEIIHCPFEGIEMAIPKDYDHVLSVLYGAYYLLPQREKRGVCHDGFVFNPDKPYKELLLNQNVV
jgi:lipopolysaccharide cholinephosphotransferase